MLTDREERIKETCSKIAELWRDLDEDMAFVRVTWCTTASEPGRYYCVHVEDFVFDGSEDGND